MTDRSGGSLWREPLLAIAGIALAIAAGAVGIAVFLRLQDNNATVAAPTADASNAASTATARAAASKSAAPASPSATTAPETPAPTETATPLPATPTPASTATPSPTPKAALTPTATPAASALSLAQAAFQLPAQATANNGGTIGPYCCRGRTVTIHSSGGDILGYAYWFQWAGQAFDAPHGGGTDSLYPDIRVLVTTTGSSGTSIDFAASELAPGLSRSRTVGNLAFTVTVTSAERTTYSGGTYVWGSSLAATLTVSAASQ
jgi:hypothetical protein